MAQYEARYRESQNGADNVLLRTNDYKRAVDACVSKVIDRGHGRDRDEARTALETRGYYVMGYGPYEVYIEEITKQ